MKPVSDKSHSTQQAHDLLDDHYSATQLRADRWSALQDISQRLAQAAADGKGIKRLREQGLSVSEAVERLVIERGSR